jgi:hypothetical protein
MLAALGGALLLMLAGLGGAGFAHDSQPWRSCFMLAGLLLMQAGFRATVCSCWQALMFLFVHASRPGVALLFMFAGLGGAVFLLKLASLV